MPIPPPWRLEGRTYVNDMTNERSQKHPLAILFPDEKQTTSLSDDKHSDVYDEDERILARIDAGLSPESPVDVSIRSSSVESSNTSSSSFSSKKDRGRFVDFRCLWKEVALFGSINAYGVLIRYYENKSVDIQFDGVDGNWKCSHLEGPYGCIERHDLIIGAKIKIFGRHLSITSANASVCHDIEEEARRLLKRIEFMQKKIESISCIPVVRRSETGASVTVGMGRGGGKPEGHSNLRFLCNDNCKLADQLSRLGLSHFVKQADDKFGGIEFKWK